MRQRRRPQDDDACRIVRKPESTARSGCATVENYAARRPRRTGEIAYATLTSIEGGVADVAAGYEIDYVFGYVGGVVADAFEIFGH